MATGTAPEAEPRHERDQREGAERSRRASGPALLRVAFRPFFLGAGLWALAAMAIWIAALQGAIALPSAFDPVAWHVHEMLFGYVGAAIAGFLLTAIPNWTGRLPIRGWPLGMLAACWLAGRLAMLLSEPLGAGLAAAIDLAFPAGLLLVVLREILVGRNWRNLPMPAVLAVLFSANLLTHLEALGWAESGALGQRLGLAAVLLLIALIGGRIVPSFTGNWLKKRDPDGPLPSPFGRFDRACLAATLAALLTWALAPDSLPAGLLLILAGLLTALRLVRWRGERTLAEPLVWSLHVGVAWLALGLALTGCGALWPNALPASAGLHALTAGAMGAMTLSVMTRATLGHSGRPLAADRATAALYVLVSLSAALRVLAALLDSGSGPLLEAAALAWIAAFGLFSLRYGRLHLAP